MANLRGALGGALQSLSRYIPLLLDPSGEQEAARSRGMTTEEFRQLKQDQANLQQLYQRNIEFDLASAEVSRRSNEASIAGREDAQVEQESRQFARNTPDLSLLAAAAKYGSPHETSMRVPAKLDSADFTYERGIMSREDDERQRIEQQMGQRERGLEMESERLALSKEAQALSERVNPPEVQWLESKYGLDSSLVPPEMWTHIYQGFKQGELAAPVLRSLQEAAFANSGETNMGDPRGPAAMPPSPSMGPLGSPGQFDIDPSELALPSTGQEDGLQRDYSSEAALDPSVPLSELRNVPGPELEANAKMQMQEVEKRYRMAVAMGMGDEEFQEKYPELWPWIEAKKKMEQGVDMTNELEQGR